MDLALLILRLVTGLALMGHGAQKLFGWFGGPGLSGVSGWLASMRLRPPRFWAFMAGGAEFGGGLLLALGLFSPLGSLGIGASMLVAIAKVHWPRFWSADNGLELPLEYLAVVLAVGIAGPGAYSLDHHLGTALSASAALMGVVLVLIGWLAVLVSTASQHGAASKTASR
jgi:putative oxidoreductase